MRLIVALLLVTQLSVMSALAHGNHEYRCIDEEEARQLFLSGELAKANNYSESAGARVQRQHPETHMFAHAKYIDHGDGTDTAMICSYSNHVGLVAMYMAVNAKTLTPIESDCETKRCRRNPYWRKEYIKSYPHQDAAGKEQVYVCMVDKGGVSYPSRKCMFVLPKH